MGEGGPLLCLLSYGRLYGRRGAVVVSLVIWAAVWEKGGRCCVSCYMGGCMGEGGPLLCLLSF